MTGQSSLFVFLIGFLFVKRRKVYLKMPFFRKTSNADLISRKLWKDLSIPHARAKQLGRPMKETTSCKKATELPG